MSWPSSEIHFDGRYQYTKSFTSRMIELARPHALHCNRLPPHAYDSIALRRPPIFHRVPKIHHLVCATLNWALYETVCFSRFQVAPLRLRKRPLHPASVLFLHPPPPISRIATGAQLRQRGLYPPLPCPIVLRKPTRRVDALPTPKPIKPAIISLSVLAFAYVLAAPKQREWRPVASVR